MKNKNNMGNTETTPKAPIKVALTDKNNKPVGYILMRASWHVYHAIMAGTMPEDGILKVMNYSLTSPREGEAPGEIPENQWCIVTFLTVKMCKKEDIGLSLTDAKMLEELQQLDETVLLELYYIAVKYGCNKYITWFNQRNFHGPICIYEYLPLLTTCYNNPEWLPCAQKILKTIEFRQILDGLTYFYISNLIDTEIIEFLLSIVPADKKENLKRIICSICRQKISYTLENNTFLIEGDAQYLKKLIDVITKKSDDS